MTHFGRPRLIAAAGPGVVALVALLLHDNLAAGTGAAVSALTVIAALIAPGSSSRRERRVALVHGRYRLMLDTLPDRVVCFQRHTGVITYCNTSYAESFSLAAGDVIGEHISKFLGPEGWAMTVEQLLPFATSEPSSSGEISWVKSDGTRVSEAWIHRVIQGDDGTEEILTLGHDITERVRSERALRKSEVRFRSLVDNLPLPAIVNGADGIIHANRAAAVLLGADRPEHLIGAKPRQLLASAFDLPDIGAPGGPHLGDLGTHRVEVVLPVGPRVLDLFVSGLELGGVEARLIVGTDVSERVSAEKALQESASFLRFLTENCADVLLRVNDKGRVLYATDSATQALGVDPAFLVGADIAELVDSAFGDALSEAFRTAADEGTTERLEVKVLHAAVDVVVWADITVHAISVPRPGSVGLEYHVTVADVTQRHLITEQLAQTQQFFERVLNSLTEGVLINGARSTATLANPAARKMLDLGNEEHPRLYSAVDSFEIVDESGDPLPLAEHPGAVVLTGGEPVRQKVIGRRCRDTGTTRWFLADSFPLGHPDGELLAVSTFVDITPRKALEDQLTIERRLLETTLQHVNASVVAVDEHAATLFMNEAAIRMRRFSAASTTVTDAADRGFTYHRPDDTALEFHEEPLMRALSGIETVNQQLVMRWADGSPPLFVSVSAVPMRDENGVQRGAVGVMHDITPLKNAEAEMSHLAHHDTLTGLGNRRMLVKALEQAVIRNARCPERVALLFCDLDGFKTVNDTLGHDIGDELLVAVAQRLSSALRPSDLVARIGGDEFVVLIEPLGDDGDELLIARRLENTLHEPFMLSSGALSTGGSVGAAVLARNGTADELLSAADKAMYERKRTRKAVLTHPEPSIHSG